MLENEKAATKDVAIQAILQKSIDDLSNGIISITDYLKGLNTELDDIDSKLDKFQSGFNDIVDIVNEYNLYGKLNQDSLQKLLRLDPQYLACLEKLGNQLKVAEENQKQFLARMLELKKSGETDSEEYADLSHKSKGLQDIIDKWRPIYLERMEMVKSVQMKKRKRTGKK